jgi:hypothetical protein
VLGCSRAVLTLRSHAACYAVVDKDGSGEMEIDEFNNLLQQSGQDWDLKDERCPVAAVQFSPNDGTMELACPHSCRQADESHVQPCLPPGSILPRFSLRAVREWIISLSALG